MATAQGRRAELNRTWHVITHCIGPMFTALVNDPLIAQACENMLDSDVMYAAISAGAADGQPSGSADLREFKSMYDAAKAAGSAMAAPTTDTVVPVSAAAAAGAQQDCARCGKKHPTELCYSGTDDRTRPPTRLPESTLTEAAKALKAQVLANRPRCRSNATTARTMDGSTTGDTIAEAALATMASLANAAARHHATRAARASAASAAGLRTEAAAAAATAAATDSFLAPACPSHAPKKWWGCKKPRGWSAQRPRTASR